MGQVGPLRKRLLRDELRSLVFICWLSADFFESITALNDSYAEEFGPLV